MFRAEEVSFMEVIDAVESCMGFHRSNIDIHAPAGLPYALNGNVQSAKPKKVGVHDLDHEATVLGGAGAGG
jgi:hypothetical protein